MNINTAGVDELTTLSGIGEKYAQRIIQYRKDNGPFKKPEDLLNIRGIGTATLEKNKNMIVVEALPVKK